MKFRIFTFVALLYYCQCGFAQTKFSGVVINQPFSTFCAEMSKKYKRNPNHEIPKANSKQVICTFYLTFLDIEDCHMNVYRKDSINKVHELEIVIPSDKSVQSYGEKGLKHYVIGAENFQRIFDIYKKKYGDKFESYNREGYAWYDISIEWKLPDVKVILQISKSKNSEDDEYFSPKVFYIVEENRTYKKTTIDDI